MTAFCTSVRFYDHQTGPHHPERPDRLRAVLTAVRDAGMIRSPNPLPDEDVHFGIYQPDAPQLLEVTPEPASMEDLLRVHPQRYIERIRYHCERGGVLDESGETLGGHGTFEAALLAAGAGKRCVDAVMTGEARRAFAAVRPPGHHAEPNAAMGFCLFGNIAIAARYAQSQYNLRRVAIVDFDVHHGNGTQRIFEADPSVLFVSLHQDPEVLYPHSGYAWEAGTGEGKGYTLNLPLPAGTDDAAYLEVVASRVIPRLEEFRPELLLISAGFDGHRDDPLADLELTEQGFYDVTRLLAEVADRHCGGRVVSMLEGGYNLRALGRSVVKHLLALAE